MDPHAGSLPRIVDDLIPLILDSNNHWWPCDYLRLSLISPEWLAPVRKRLYTCPTIRSYRACTLLARTLSERPEYSALIREMDLRPFAEYNSGGIACYDMESVKLLLGLDSLRSVTLGADLAVRAERFLSWINSTSLEELHVDGKQRRLGYGCSRYQQPASLTWDHELCGRFTKLTSLRLSNIELHILPSASPIPQLTELNVERVEVLVGHLHQLSSDWSSLRHLSIEARCTSDFDRHIRLLLSHCGPSLESLHYDVRDVHLDEAIFHDSLVSCPALRELRLNGLDVNLGTLSSIGQRCGNLEQLSVEGRVVRVTSNEWAAFIGSGALPSLQHLKTPPGTHAPPFSYWSEAMGRQVIDACAARGIKLANVFLRSHL
ncbi:hypothetical protein GLOTRDRAFT_124635 [Gloeophyllum trabeum ATCC 11539]|uniref:F-box domain-containing protein n=1 Tax=Gloeophyllum trabeum (strain ATCC 11539 / FP-39264 / Madison 617) TaxID=670483 RepID=S7QN24_GLOTA|nr:uncharacterized protein GLOTRDRAFT_124635 [Gloeophyllum trabeum ATCC 11539]EPQ60893.1 hypothetical protein GLOTRDRAFT_124635 [Gloeophyllum trabeum ATCC 11539]